MNAKIKVNKPVVNIENGFIRDRGDWKQLCGRAVNHPRLGSQNISSSVIVDIRDEGKTVETLNTIYKLV